MTFLYPDGTSEQARSIVEWTRGSALLAVGASEVRCECCHELGASSPPCDDLNGAWLCAPCRVECIHVA